MRKRTIASVAFFTLAANVFAQTPAPRPADTRVSIRFVPASDSFASAATEYERIWAGDGQRIVHAMERLAGLAFVSALFADTAIVANVREVASSSGFRQSPMTLRASYSTDTKKATLIHELGHRLMHGLFKREEEEHQYLFLWVYDVWTVLYGRQFADEQVDIERRRRGPYPAAWDYALKFTPAERAEQWSMILKERLASRR
jgi:hypothetical protein